MPSEAIREITVEMTGRVRSAEAGAARPPPGRLRRTNASLASPTARRRSRSLSPKAKPNAEIGAELFMSIGTAKAHVTRVLMKLELDNRVQVALRAHDAGLTDRQN